MLLASVELGHEYHMVELARRLNQNQLDALTEIFGLSSSRTWIYRHPNILFYDAKQHLMFLLSVTHEC